jgi:hypothetical protein
MHLTAWLSGDIGWPYPLGKPNSPRALKKHIITVFKPMYLEVLNDDMVVFANITAQEIMDHLFMSYGNITAVDLENNFEQMRRAWVMNFI